MQRFSHTWSDNHVKGTVVNPTLPSLHGESLEVTPQAPLMKTVKKVFLLGFLWKILQKESMIQFDERQLSVFENGELKGKFYKCWSVKNVNIWGKRVLTDFEIDFPKLIKFPSNKLHLGDRNYTTRRRIEGTGTIQLGEG